MENYITTIEKDGKKYTIGGEYYFINTDELVTVGDIMDQIPDCAEGVKYSVFWITSSRGAKVGSFRFDMVSGEDDFYVAEIEMLGLESSIWSDESFVLRGSENTLQDLKSLELKSLDLYPMYMVPTTVGLDSRKNYKLSWRDDGLQWVEA